MHVYQVCVSLGIVSVHLLIQACGGDVSNPSAYVTAEPDFFQSNSTKELDYLEGVSVSVIDRTMIIPNGDEKGCWKKPSGEIRRNKQGQQICFSEFAHHGERDHRKLSSKDGQNNQESLRYHPLIDPHFIQNAELTEAEVKLLGQFTRYMFGNHPSHYFLYEGNKTLFIINGSLGTKNFLGEEYLREFYVIGNLEWSMDFQGELKARVINLPGFAFDSGVTSNVASMAGIEKLDDFIHLTSKATKVFQEVFLPSKQSFLDFILELKPNFQRTNNFKISDFI